MFLLTLPLSVPLWLLAVIMVGIRGAMKEAYRPIRAFWSAPPRRHNDYYGYGHHHHRSKVVPIEKRDAA
jgi:hypothetical protein